MKKRKFFWGKAVFMLAAIAGAPGFCPPCAATDAGGSAPVLVISEVRTEYSRPKVEFIELYALTSGNLACVTLYSAYDSASRAYEFAPCEVKAGEYIVLHYRRLADEAALCVDETGDDLSLSSAADSSESRDIWVDNVTACIGKSDVILLRDGKSGRIMDAVLFTESRKSGWKNSEIRKAASDAHASGLWPEGAGVDAAVISDGTTATRTISRQNIEAIKTAGAYSGAANGRNVWLVTDTRTASPGRPNSSRAYTAPEKR